jgi:hypothetical protein
VLFNFFSPVEGELPLPDARVCFACFSFFVIFYLRVEKLIKTYF